MKSKDKYIIKISCDVKPFLEILVEKTSFFIAGLATPGNT